MTGVAINRFRVRCRIPRGTQTRVKGIVADAIARILEGAIEHAGIAKEGYLCIRELHTLVTLRLRDADSALAESLGRAIADSISEMIRKGSPLVVHYRSRAHALVDLGASALSGDFERAWAWVQIGMWRTDSPVRHDLAAEAVMYTLAREPRHALAALGYLARARNDAVSSLIDLATSAAWVALARAAVKASGSTLDPVKPPFDRLSEFGADRSAKRIVGESAIARTTVATMGKLPIETRLALAALVILEVEPALIHKGVERARLMLAAVEREFHCADANPSIRFRHEGGMAEKPGHEPLVVANEFQTTQQRPGNDGRFGNGHLVAANRPGIEAGLEGAEYPESEPAPASDVDLSDLRRRAWTEHGGLLYLINLAGRIGLAERILSDHRLSERGLRWALNQIGAALAGVEPGNPATLGFAGMLPDVQPPGSSAAPPNDAELSAISEYRGTLAKELRKVLDGGAETETSVIDFVLRRRARIEADPGWIEVYFSFNDVSTEIRRAGLDLDPDWVPWLGIVMRFIYV
jgi:hypothetical protein